MKSNYWSCSKLADWLRGTPKPLAGSPKEWNAWGKTAKAKKIRYLLAEDGLDFLQNLVHWPLDLINNTRHYFDNRWVSKTHALTSNLKPGKWHEFDTRILHALFDELVNFVEIEQAGSFVLDSEEQHRNHAVPWYRKIPFLRESHSPQAGLAHLEWAAGLKNDGDWVDKKDPNFGQSTPQALAAQETIVLYKWWKVGRPKRPDPMEASGWSAFCEENRRAHADDFFWIGCDINEADSERSRKISEISHRMEQEQEDEDTEMLIRLIKIRGSLWT